MLNLLIQGMKELINMKSIRLQSDTDKPNPRISDVVIVKS